MRDRILLTALIFLTIPLLQASAGDLRQGAGVKFILGTAAFLDEETPFDHFLIGGSAIIGLTPRLRVEPQFLYMNGPGSDRDITVTGNVSYDLVKGDRADVYVVGGGGLLRQTSDFDSGPFSSSEWTVSGGVGVRIYLSEKLFLAPEFRFGFEPLLQVLVGAGYSF